MSTRIWKTSFIFLTVFVPLLLFGLVDLEDNVQSFVLETKQIHIPGHPHAFNPSIVRWRGSLLFSFREIQDDCSMASSPINSAGDSRIGLVWLDENFEPDGEAQILDLYAGETQDTKSRSEDARLIATDDKLYMVYSDNRHPVLTEGGFRLHVGEIEYDGSRFTIKNIDCLNQFEGESPRRREKNWVPFAYQGKLLLAYSLAPHRILRPWLGCGICSTLATTWKRMNWTWGELRGGTPGILIDADRYLSIFHSSQCMPSIHSDGESVLHYFMGAYTFSSRPPFEIAQISPEPIVGKGFYHGMSYTPYWKPVRVVFPCGILDDGEFIWVSYGRQDHEVWLVKLDKAALLDSLVDAN